MRIRRSRSVRALLVTAAVGLVFGGATAGQANALPDPGSLPAPVPAPEVPNVLDLPKPQEGPTVPEPDGPDGPQAPETSELPDAPANANCSEDPGVDVDQSDPAFTTITISLTCEADAEFHRIITATAGSVELLRIDTRTVVNADASHSTSITIPKAEVCVTNGTTGEELCLP